MSVMHVFTTEIYRIDLNKNLIQKIVKYQEWDFIAVYNSLTGGYKENATRLLRCAQK